jgi:hypothetical protein
MGSRVEAEPPWRTARCSRVVRPTPFADHTRLHQRLQVAAGGAAAHIRKSSQFGGARQAHLGEAAKQPQPRRICEHLEPAGMEDVVGSR